MRSQSKLPRFFRLRQSFERPRIDDIRAAVKSELGRVCKQDLNGKRVAITAGSRGISNIAQVTRACVDFVRSRGAEPFVVPAMGSHGGATAEGQLTVLASFGITEATMGCPIHSSMDAVQVCIADEGFPVYFDRYAHDADGVLVVNRIKPHTRFAGAIESGLMKMMLIGLGKQTGAEIYHRTLVQHPFDTIVRSVAKEVIARCNIIGGLAILENAYEETAAIRALPAADIESGEPGLLAQVKKWMPSLPFDHAELLVIDQIGKNISGTGMDTNVVGRKKNDHAAIHGDRPSLHHIYVRGLTTETHGNASGIGLAEMCHRRVLADIDRAATRMNCITAGHVTGAMLPIDFENDWDALTTACQLAGYIPPAEVPVMWIKDTLHLGEVECSEVFWDAAHQLQAQVFQAQAATASAGQSEAVHDTSVQYEVLSPLRALEFDAEQNLHSWF